MDVGDEDDGNQIIGKVPMSGIEFIDEWWKTKNGMPCLSLSLSLSNALVRTHKHEWKILHLPIFSRKF